MSMHLSTKHATVLHKARERNRQQSIHCRIQSEIALAKQIQAQVKCDWTDALKEAKRLMDKWGSEK